MAKCLIPGERILNLTRTALLQEDSSKDNGYEDATRHIGLYLFLARLRLAYAPHLNFQVQIRNAQSRAAYSLNNQ